MDSRKPDADRRRILRAGLSGAIAAPLVAFLGTSRQAFAQSDMPKLAEDDPTAKALNYHEDAAAVDSSARQDGAHCANCQLYQGSADSEWGGCGAFPGKSVHAQGWCSAWVKKA